MQGMRQQYIFKTVGEAAEARHKTLDEAQCI